MLADCSADAGADIIALANVLQIGPISAAMDRYLNRRLGTAMVRPGHDRPERRRHAGPVMRPVAGSSPIIVRITGLARLQLGEPCAW